MKVFAVVLWGLLLFVFTCTVNVDTLLHNYALAFHFTPHPDFADLFRLQDIQLTSTHYLFQKIGHFIGFGILAALLVNATGSRRKAFVLAVFFAVLTEILQLYFARDGRIFDMGIDTLGIALALFIYDK